MHTKVRIQKSLDTGQYQTLYFQFLYNRYKDASTHFEAMGTITFLRTTKDLPERWYGLRYVIETDNPTHILQMAYIAKHIYLHASYDTQPDEILKLINAEIYFYHESYFLPLSDIGKRFYKVIKDKKYIRVLIATRDAMAQKQFRKQKLEGKLVFSHIISNTDF